MTTYIDDIETVLPNVHHQGLKKCSDLVSDAQVQLISGSENRNQYFFLEKLTCLTLREQFKIEKNYLKKVQKIT